VLESNVGAGLAISTRGSPSVRLSFSSRRYCFVGRFILLGSLRHEILDRLLVLRSDFGGEIGIRRRGILRRVVRGGIAIVRLAIHF
jgi:hypothetical protein